ncbi:unnamed protein product [Closterium sp. NIES-65]|nr:unnamed protein product [Closterium sp. NIES-65]
MVSELQRLTPCASTLSRPPSPLALTHVPEPPPHELRSAARSLPPPLSSLTAVHSADEGGRDHRGEFRLRGRTRPPRRIPPTRADATTAADSADEGGRDHRGGFPLTDALPQVTRRIRGRTHTHGRRGTSADGRAPAGDEAHPRTDAHPRATRRIRGRTRTRGRRGASADGRAPAGVEAHPRTDAHPRATRRIRGRTRTRGRRGASADGRAPAGDEAHPRTDAHPRASRRIRGRTRTRGRRGASADGRAPAGVEAHPRTDAHPRATRRIRGRTRTRGRRGASADGRAPAGDEAHPRADAHPRATRRIRGRTRTRERTRTRGPRGAITGDTNAAASNPAPPYPVSSPPPLLLLMADDSTPIELGAIDKLELLHDTTAVNWASFEDTLHTHLGSVIIQDYCLLDVVLEHPNGLPPVLPPPLEPPPPDAPRPPEPLPDPPRAPVHDDNPDRWGANLNTYNRLRDTYTLQREAHRVAEAAHADATARLLSYAQHEKDYAEELRKIHKDVAAWRIADRRALAIIFSCIPSHLKRDLRPTSSSGLWKTLSTQYDRQDLRSLLALFRKFQDITLDSSPTAAAYTRRLIDTAQRLNDRGIVISESLLTARILDCLPPTYDTYRITFTSRYRHPPPVADTIDISHLTSFNKFSIFSPPLPPHPLLPHPHLRLKPLPLTTLHPMLAGLTLLTHLLDMVMHLLDLLPLLLNHHPPPPTLLALLHSPLLDS